MNAYTKIRAALEMATGGRPSNIAAAQEALAALAELERAAAEPVAWCNGDNLDIGIPLRFQAFTRPQQFTDTPLYTTPPPANPAPLGPALGLVELKEPTPEECERICAAYHNPGFDRELGVRVGGKMFDAVRAVMWPKEGL